MNCTHGESWNDLGEGVSLMELLKLMLSYYILPPNHGLPQFANNSRVAEKDVCSVGKKVVDLTISGLRAPK